MPLCREEETEELARGRDICLERCSAVSHQPSADFCMMEKKKKMMKNHYIFSSQPRADQMPGPPREVQVTCELFLERMEIRKIPAEISAPP